MKRRRPRQQATAGAVLRLAGKGNGRTECICRVSCPTLRPPCPHFALGQPLHCWRGPGSPLRACSKRVFRPRLARHRRPDWRATRHPTQPCGRPVRKAVPCLRRCRIPSDRPGPMLSPHPQQRKRKWADSRAALQASPSGSIPSFPASPSPSSVLSSVPSRPPLAQTHEGPSDCSPGPFA